MEGRKSSLLNLFKKKTIMKQDKYLYFNTPAQSSVVITPVGSDTLTFTAVKTGAFGNLISVTVAEAGSDSEVAISVSGNAITINIGTANDMGVDNIATAYAVDAAGPNAARALATLAVSGTAHISAAVAQTFLAGGDVSVCFPASSIAGMAPISDTALGVYFKSLYNFDGIDYTSGEEVISDFVDLTINSNHDHKGVMTEICETLNSPQGGYGFITIADSGSTNPVVDASFIHPDVTASAKTIAASIA
tara:strand:- start:3607 stop:4350 length:744 start_codon:yes stop_codon:yes gene_type:complete